MNNRFSFLPALILSLAAPALAQAPAAPVKFDFQAYALGDLPGELVVTDGEAKFAITADGENHVLEMNPSPLVDGGVLLGPSVKGAVTITARIKAEGKRRSHPRFGVGLHGVGGYRCLVVPSVKELQFVKEEEMLARVPYTWKSGTWTVMEFSVMAAADGGSNLEARAWEEGQPRPEAALLTFAVKTPPATGKASLWAAPYAELPIAFDDVVIAARP
jgi:hypothetical protein